MNTSINLKKTNFLFILFIFGLHLFFLKEQLIMKKMPFCLATIMLLILSVTSIKTNAQAFQKGNWNIDVYLGTGLTIKF